MDWGKFSPDTGNNKASGIALDNNNNNNNNNNINDKICKRSK